jgi:hypothetical protein
MTNPRNLILIVLAIGLFYTFGSPQYREVKTLQASASEYKNVIENVSRIAESRDALLVAYEAIPPSEREKLMKVLPNNIDSVRLALDLDTIAGRYGIAVKNVGVSAKADSNSALAVIPDNRVPYEKAVVTFSFVSTYENFMSFLGDLEKSLRIMDVKSVSFQVSENGLYEHELQVETYWLK